MKQKFIGKFMRLAAQIGKDENPCHSRKVGVVIVSPHNNRILGTGYNGPAPGTPHCDSYEFLKEFFWPQLSDGERTSFAHQFTKYSEGELQLTDDVTCERMAVHYDGCKVCPRRLVKAGPGERSELCSCGHAERHAITNAACDCTGAVMFVSNTTPCVQCADAIIQAGIHDVYCVGDETYDVRALWLLEQAGVVVFRLKEEILNGNATT